MFSSLSGRAVFLETLKASILVEFSGGSDEDPFSALVKELRCLWIGLDCLCCYHVNSYGIYSRESLERKRERIYSMILKNSREVQIVFLISMILPHLLISPIPYNNPETVIPSVSHSSARILILSPSSMSHFSLSRYIPFRTFRPQPLSCVTIFQHFRPAIVLSMICR